MMRLAVVFLTLFMAFAGASEEVVVYTALDEMYSRPVLDRFEEETGIRVRAAYDSEASKTTGLVNRILAERRRPRCDVFWNNEVAQTILLKTKGALTRYVSSGAAAIPESFKDSEGYWTGLAARARVIIYNTELVEHPPTSIHEFADPMWRGRGAIALPLFGTTATHAAALFAHWGEGDAEKFFRAIKANDTAILPGNAQVRDMVASGEYSFGLTDTDDANGAVVDGAPAKWIFPDQDTDLGTLLIPNTVALIAGAPNEASGKKLIDFLLSPEVEAMLAGMRSIQVPLNPDVARPASFPEIDSIRTMDVSFEAIAESMAESMVFIREEFQR